MTHRIIVTGSTGFVGRHVLAKLGAAGPRPIVCTSRDPERARAKAPGKTWAKLDVSAPDTIKRLLAPNDRVFYLVHGMSEGEGYAEREAFAAETFGRLARDAGVDRIVYLGGPRPPGSPSKHLASRLRTGEILRDSGVSTLELRAGMIMGGGSESWKITRDLSVRLPVMLLPKWLNNRCEPIAIDDVVAALIAALDAPDELAGAWDLPGPERLTYAEVIYRVAAIRGTRPLGIPIPLLTPRLSSHWLRLVTRADMNVAKELVDGLKYDLICDGDGFFTHMPAYERTPFDQAAREALRAEQASIPLGAVALEYLLRGLSRHAR